MPVRLVLGGGVLHDRVRRVENAVRHATGRIGRQALSVAWRMIPPGDGFVVYAGASLEPNGLTTIAAALHEGVRPITLLVDNSVPASRAKAALEGCGADADRIAVVRRRSLRGLLAFLRAPTVMFTHIVNGGITPPNNRLAVNIWHGDGPKTTVPSRQVSARRASRFVVSGTALWGADKAASFNLRTEDLLLTGNPRTSLFSRPVGEDSLVALGLRRDVPVILWAPTYRATAGPKGWADSAKANAFREILADGGRALRDAAEASGRQIALRPHPRDKVTFADVQFPVITDEALLGVRANLYSFLPHVASLVTDYSSIWTDFLLLDRPIAFFCPDLADYSHGRGMGQGFEDILPGPLFQTDAEFLTYLGSESMDDDRQRERRRLVKGGIGLVESSSPAEDLVSWALTRRGAPARSSASGATGGPTG